MNGTAAKLTVTLNDWQNQSLSSSLTMRNAVHNSHSLTDREESQKIMCAKDGNCGDDFPITHMLPVETAVLSVVSRHEADFLSNKRRTEQSFFSQQSHAHDKLVAHG